MKIFFLRDLCGFKIIKYCSLLSLIIGLNGISFYVGYLIGKENERDKWKSKGNDGKQKGGKHDR